MTQKLLLTAVILLQAASAASGADATGKWTISQQGLNGGAPHVTTLDLKVDGMAVTGTVTAPMGGRGAAIAAPVAIANGKANGNTISFEVVRTFAGNSVTTRYEATVSGDSMHVKQTLDVGKGPQTVAVDAKRATP